jgi:hypothetical protein
VRPSSRLDAAVTVRAPWDALHERRQREAVNGGGTGDHTARQPEDCQTTATSCQGWRRSVRTGVPKRLPQLKI